jgi:hypothetical protein
VLCFCMMFMQRMQQSRRKKRRRRGEEEEEEEKGKEAVTLSFYPRSSHNLQFWYLCLD